MGTPSEEGNARRPLPRETLIILTVAAAIVSALGLRVFADILAPALLALILVISVQPVRAKALSLKLPLWAATTITLITLYSIVAGFTLMIVLAGGHFVTVLSEYKPYFQDLVADAGQALAQTGVGSTPIESTLSSIDVGKVVGFATSLIGGVAGLLSSATFIVILLFFVALDAGSFVEKLRWVPASGSRMAKSFVIFAKGTRDYSQMSTLFGLIIALIDVAALYVLDIPDPWLWGMLAFLTNYIPNIGFIIGVIPPALIALMEHDPGTALAVVVVYSVVNFVIQTLIQPRVVGSQVGLSGTVAFLSLVFWAMIFGGIGAVLAVPLTLLIRAVFIDVVPERAWLSHLISSDKQDGNNDGR